MRSGRIYLIGFMGAGKSHTGRRLAQLLEAPFIDLDDWIEDKAAATIAEIFSREGETGFREREREALHATATVEQAVIATGGGLPCFFNNMDWMKEQGLAVYLKVPEDILVERLAGGRGHRPLLRGESAAELPTFVHHKLRERRPYYEAAEVIYEVKAKDEEVARHLYEHLGRIMGH